MQLEHGPLDGVLYVTVCLRYLSDTILFLGELTNYSTLW
jgi:hypothetical protein